MPDNENTAAAKSETTEFEFAPTPEETPRLKRRSLKAKPKLAAAEMASSPSPDQNVPTTSESRPPITHDSPRPAVYFRPDSQNPTPAAPAAAPSGPLYYSNGPQKEGTPMKTTPLASSQASRPAASSPSTPATGTSATARPATAATSGASASSGATASAAPTSSISPASTAARPAASTATAAASSPRASASSSSPAASRPAAAASTSTSAASAPRNTTTTLAAANSVRPTGVSDYRSNIDRQAREQKSMGSVLSLIVYSLIGLFVVFAGLAIYGASSLSKQIRQQSLTISDLDNHYSAQNQALSAQLKATQQNLLLIQAQGNREQELLVRQQDSLGKLAASTDSNSDELRQEKAARMAEATARASEAAALRARIRTLEARASQPVYRP